MIRKVLFVLYLMCAFMVLYWTVSDSQAQPKKAPPTSLEEVTTIQTDEFVTFLSKRSSDYVANIRTVQQAAEEWKKQNTGFIVSPHFSTSSMHVPYAGQQYSMTLRGGKK